MEANKLEQLKIEREPERDFHPGRWFLLIAALAALVAGAAWWYLRPPVATPVKTAEVREISGQVAGTVLNASGYVTARRQATVSSKFTGKVMEVLIEEGMRVEKGQVLATLDDSNLRASFALAEAQLRSTGTVQKETEALLREARASLARTLNLIERGLSSESQLDSARATSDALAAKLERNQADVEVAEKQLDIYRQQLEDTVIRAPFAGVVVAKNAQPGEMISPNSAGGGFTRTGIGTIVDMDSLEIEIDVNETYINRVSPGQKVVATLDAYSDWRIPAHVIAIIPTADRQRATVEVRVGFDELDTRILPDMGVKVAFQDDTGMDSARKTSIVVPQAAVTGDGGKAYVWVIEDNVVDRRMIATGGTRGDGILVASGLEAGERVIINPPGSLKNGDRVTESRE